MSTDGQIQAGKIQVEHIRKYTLENTTHVHVAKGFGLQRWWISERSTCKADLHLNVEKIEDDFDLARKERDHRKPKEYGAGRMVQIEIGGHKFPKMRVRQHNPADNRLNELAG